MMISNRAWLRSKLVDIETDYNKAKRAKKQMSHHGAINIKGQTTQTASTKMHREGDNEAQFFWVSTLDWAIADSN